MDVKGRIDEYWERWNAGDGKWVNEGLRLLEQLNVQLATAREEALEEAASIVDKKGHEWWAYSRMTIEVLSYCIRAAKSKKAGAL